VAGSNPSGRHVPWSFAAKAIATPAGMTPQSRHAWDLSAVEATDRMSGVGKPRLPIAVDPRGRLPNMSRL
jgi:hypothetical protein